MRASPGACSSTRGPVREPREPQWQKTTFCRRTDNSMSRVNATTCGIACGMLPCVNCSAPTEVPNHEAREYTAKTHLDGVTGNHKLVEVSVLRVMVACRASIPSSKRKSSFVVQASSPQHVRTPQHCGVLTDVDRVESGGGFAFTSCVLRCPLLRRSRCDRWMSWRPQSRSHALRVQCCQRCQRPL